MVLAGGEQHVDQAVVLLQQDRDDAAAVDVAVVLQGAPLHAALRRREEEVVLALLEVCDRQERADPLAVPQLEQVDDGPAPADAGELRQLEDLDLEDAAGVGEAEQVVVRGADEQVLEVVVLVDVAALDAGAAAALRAIGVERQPLDVAGVAHRDRDGMLGDEVAEDEVLGFVLLDRGAAIVAEAAADLLGVGPHDAHEDRGVVEDLLEAGDLRGELVELLQEPCDFEPGELDEPQRADRVGLRAGERHAVSLRGEVAEPLRDVVRAGMVRGDAEPKPHELRDRLLARLARADRRDHLVEVEHREDEPLETVGLLAGLPQLELGAAADHLAAMVDVALDELLEGQRARLAVDERDVDDREGVLQRRELVELPLDHLGIAATLEHHEDPGRRVAAGVVADLGDVGDAPALRRVDDLLDEVRLIDLVGDLVDHDRVAPAHLVAVHAAAHDHPPAAGRVRLGDAAAAHDPSAGGEVGARHDLEQSVEADLRIVDRRDDRAADLRGVVRRDRARHADRDAARAVAEQVREAARQDGRLLEPLVVVGLEVDGVLIEVVEQLRRDRGHPRFGVPHRRRRIAFDRAEVALLVDEQVAGLPPLPEVDERGIDDALAVRVVVARGVAGDLRALDVLAPRRQVEVVHRDEDSSLRGLESVTDVGQRPVHDRAHRVGQVAVVELAIDLEIDHPIARRRRVGTGRLRIVRIGLGWIGHAVGSGDLRCLRTGRKARVPWGRIAKPGL